MAPNNIDFGERKQPSAFFCLEPGITFLNHGSFGACPRPVLEEQRRLQERLEAEPVRFMMREREGLADRARGTLASFVGADRDDLVFVSNATMAVNTVARSLELQPGDELLTTDHAYNACVNALRYVAERSGAKVVVAAVPFPLSKSKQVVDAVLAAVTPRTRFALIDHVTSPTGLIFPIDELVTALKARGVETMVDGAHAPGMVPLDLKALDAAWYTGNLHKWVCAPKGAAFLHVRRALQDKVRPLVISHGANSPRTDKSRFQLEFDWVGTMDPTPALCVPKALEVMGQLEPGGWPALMRRNRALALAMRDVICRELRIDNPAPDKMLASLVAAPLPDGDAQAVQDLLFLEHNVEVPIVPWPAPPHRLVRVSAQHYNSLADVERLMEVLA
jgi:isopenicillin-N epimerase